MNIEKYNLKVERLNLDVHLKALLQFCEECNTLGYKNNNSLKSMKITPNTLKTKFYCIFDGIKIVGISGVHPLRIEDTEYYRILFRGCILPRYQSFINEIGLSKKHLNSVVFRYLVPLQVNEVLKVSKDEKLVITTNSSFNTADPSGKMFKSDRVMKYLAKQNYLKCIHSNIKLFNCIQNVWEVTDFGLSQIWGIKR